DVVGAAGAAGAERLRTQVGEGGKPLAEDGAHGFVGFHVDAADLAGAVVEVEVGAELVVLVAADEGSGGLRRRGVAGGARGGPASAAAALAGAGRVSVGGVGVGVGLGVVAEVFLDVAL